MLINNEATSLFYLKLAAVIGTAGLFIFALDVLPEFL